MWKLNYSGSALVISSGLVYLNNRKPKGLRLEEVLAMIEAEPEKSYYFKIKPRRVTLGEAVAHNELDRLGELRHYYSAIDLILLEPEREFSKLPKTGRELLSKHYRSKAKEVKQ